MSNAAKKKPEELAEKSELPSDREEGLAKNFDDPGLDGILLDLSEAPNNAGVLNETAEALQELMAEPGEEVDPLNLLGEINPSLDAGDIQHVPDPENADTPTPTFMAMEDSALESLQVNARWEMAEKLFELVVCELPFADLLEATLGAVVGGMGAEAGSILESDREKKEFFFRASIGGGDPEQLKSFRVPANKGIVGHVAESRQPLLLRDLNSDELQLRAISAGTGFETHTCIAAPIVVANQLYGVIELFNKKSGGSFDERDVQRLEDTIRMVTKILEVRFLMAELARRAA